MAILITLFLVLVNIFNAQISSQPYAGKSASNNQEIATRKVNLNGEYLLFTENVTAISVWILFCIFFVFAALMAYARLDFCPAIVYNSKQTDLFIYFILSDT